MTKYPENTSGHPQNFVEYSKIIDLASTAAQERQTRTPNGMYSIFLMALYDRIDNVCRVPLIKLSQGASANKASFHKIQADHRGRVGIS